MDKLNVATFADKSSLEVQADKVLVELIDDFAGGVTESGIIMPEVKHRGAPTKGKVLAVGSRCKEDDIKKGVIAHFFIDRLRGFRHADLELAAIPWEAIVATSNE